MYKVPPEFLKKIKESINIVELIGEHVVLKKSGSNYLGLCPFHSEKTPSFSVSESKQVYHCYGCKAGGDVFTFVLQTHGLSFIESVEELAERLQIPLPKNWRANTANNVERKEKEEVLYRLNRFVAAFYRKNLEEKNFLNANGYLNNRNVNKATQKDFYLGAAHYSWDSLALKLISSKAPLEKAQELGLIRPSAKVGSTTDFGYFDLFRNRIVFPILDLRGRVAGFGGRLIPETTNQNLNDSAPKYLNSPESSIFKKSKLAFGLYQAQKFIREKDQLILVEGYFDVLALYQAGFKNVIATCGTALSDEHLSLFKRFTSQIILLFDGDLAGQQAMDRAMIVGLEHGVVLYGAFLPKGLDPDELVLKNKEGASQVEELIVNSKPLLDLRIEQAIEESKNGNEAMVKSLKKIANWLNLFKDPIGKEVRIQAVCKKMNIQRELLNQPTAVYKVTKEVAKTVSPPLVQGITPNDRILFLTLIQAFNNSEKFSWFWSEITLKLTISDLFDDPRLKKLAFELMRMRNDSSKQPLTTHDLFELTDDIQVRSIISEAVLLEGDKISLVLEKRVFFLRLKRVWAQFSQKLKVALEGTEAQNDMDLRFKLMKDYLDVQRRIKELNTFYDKNE